MLDPLSEREIEILALIANGFSNQDLADELVLTVGTVKWHLNNMYSKLAVRSRTQAVAKARELGLL
jgi:LuxR family maltose regulon positive regulatory protein